MKKQITMFLTNGFNPDVRVYKEALYLVEHGFSVKILCWDREECVDYTAHEMVDGIEIVRQNFGFDLEKGVTEVTLDLETEHYYLEIQAKD